MLEVQKVLQAGGLEALEATGLGIRVKAYDEGLYVLNYDQIESPKAHPIVMECRSLILDKEWNVVSRGFDRFFNIGEQPDTQAHLDWKIALCHAKVDGSLIKIYNYNGKWEISTRGTAFAESNCNFGLSFRELVLRALSMTEEQFQEAADKWLSWHITYLCELTCLENRVVKRYDEDGLWYLAARDNETGEYWTMVEGRYARELGTKLPKSFRFDTPEACIETATHLKDLDEGYVVYQDGVPVCKVKSPAYVAVHHIRGEGLTPKRIAQLVLINEQDEYLTYFPEDAKFFTPYVEALDDLMVDMVVEYAFSSDIESQKDFALRVKDLPFASVLFMARRDNITPIDAFNKQSEAYKMKLLEASL